MKIRLIKTILSLLFACGLVSLAVGARTPDQIEPRTPISSVPFTISAAGSYYLTKNLAVASGDAITITADNVTVDLNGFTLSSTQTTPAGTGILLSGDRKHIHILNGHIKGSGFLNGIYYSGAIPLNVRITGVSVSGCQSHGIYMAAGNATVAESCTVHTVGGYGIFADSVTNSTAYQCGTGGIVGTTVQNCYATTTGSDASAIYAWTINNCYGYSTGSAGYGIYALGVANNCYGQSVSGIGVQAITATGCQGYSGSGIGVFAQTAQNCHGESGGSGRGVFAHTAQNCFGRSTSGTGIDAFPAENCSGISDSGIGVFAETAQNCFGASDSTYCIAAQIAIGCATFGGIGGTPFSPTTHQYFCGSGPNPYP
jgi:hypothetical protein